MILSLLARALGAFLAPQPWTFESASWSETTRGGGDEPARPLVLPRPRPRPAAASEDAA